MYYNYEDDQNNSSHSTTVILISALWCESINFQINVLGVCIVNREYMKQMKERGVDNGHIIILNRFAF